MSETKGTYDDDGSPNSWVRPVTVNIVEETRTTHNGECEEVKRIEQYEEEEEREDLAEDDKTEDETEDEQDTNEPSVILKATQSLIRTTEEYSPNRYHYKHRTQPVIAIPHSRVQINDTESGKGKDHQKEVIQQVVASPLSVRCDDHYDEHKTNTPSTITNITFNQDEDSKSGGDEFKTGAEASDTDSNSNMTSALDTTPPPEIKVAAKLDPESNLYKALQAKWELMFRRLEMFKLANGHCCVPNRYEKDKPLGAWVSTQRRQYKIFTGKGSKGEQQSSHMTEDRMRRLNEIGFVWKATDPRHTPWETRYQQLKHFHKEHGHTLIPIGYKENPSLSYWVSSQRQDYRAHISGKNKSRLTPERIKLMNEINFSWDAKEGLKDEVHRRLNGGFSVFSHSNKSSSNKRDAAESGINGHINDTRESNDQSSCSIRRTRLRLSTLKEDIYSPSFKSDNGKVTKSTSPSVDVSSVGFGPSPESVESSITTSFVRRQMEGRAFDGSCTIRNSIIAPSLSPTSTNAFTMQDLLQYQQATRRSLLGIRQSFGSVNLDTATSASTSINASSVAAAVLQQQTDQLQHLLVQQQQSQQLLLAVGHLPGATALSSCLFPSAATQNSLGALLLQKRQLQAASLLKRQQRHVVASAAYLSTTPNAAPRSIMTSNLSSMLTTDGDLSINVKNGGLDRGRSVYVNGATGTANLGGSLF